MKNFILFLGLALTGIHTSAQESWQATKLTDVIYLPVTSMESHHDELFATVFNGYTGTLNKLNADKKSWTQINTGDITVPRFIQSAGTRMYLSSVNSGVFSMLYYSYDNGAHFILDTVGLPKFFSGVSLIAGLQYYHGKVIANLGGNGYYLKDTSDITWKSINVPTALNGGVDPLTCSNDTLYAYDNTGTNTLYFSADWGTTWTVQVSDLPSDFGTNRLVADPVSGRLYAGGVWNNSTLTGLYYSDNRGKNWILADLSAFISKSAGGTPQQVTSIYANGPTLCIALENNSNNSAPDILSSSSGLAGLGYDTAGLPVAAAGVYGVKFLMHKNQLALSLNVIDVYLKGATSTGIRKSISETKQFTLFPNPAWDYLHIDNEQHLPYTEVQILNAAGQLVLSDTGMPADINIAELPKGVYFIRLSSVEQIFSVQKFVKE